MALVTMAKHCDQESALLALLVTCHSKFLTTSRRNTNEAPMKMAWRKELSSDLKKTIIQQYERGKSHSQLSHFFQLPCSTLHYIISKWKSTGNTIDLLRAGCPQKLSRRSEVKLLWATIVTPMATWQDLKDSLGEARRHVSVSTVTRALRRNGLHSRYPGKVPLKTKRHL